MKRVLNSKEESDNLFWFKHGVKAGYHDASFITAKIYKMNYKYFNVYQEGYKQGQLLSALGLTREEMRAYLIVPSGHS